MLVVLVLRLLGGAQFSKALRNKGKLAHTHTHTLQTSGRSSASTNQHRRSLFFGQVDGSTGGLAGGRLAEAEHKKKKEKKERETTTLAQGVQAARTLSLSSKRQCDLVGLEPRAAHAASRRVAANSTRALQLRLRCGAAATAAAPWCFCLGEDLQQGASPPAEANLRLQLVVEAQGLVSGLTGIRLQRNFLLLNRF